MGLTMLESGETMRAAGLTAISTVLESTAVLIKNKNPSNPELIQRIAGRLRGVIGKRYIVSNVLIHRLTFSASKTRKSTFCARTMSVEGTFPKLLVLHRENARQQLPR